MLKTLSMTLLTSLSDSIVRTTWESNATVALYHTVTQSGQDSRYIYNQGRGFYSKHGVAYHG